MHMSAPPAEYLPRSQVVHAVAPSRSEYVSATQSIQTGIVVTDYKFIFSLSLLAIARLKTKSSKIQRVWKYKKNLWVTGVYVCIYVYNSDYLDDNL
jgi:hypothetical protein